MGIHKAFRVTAAVAALATTASLAQAQDGMLTGRIDLGARFYTNDGLYFGQSGQGLEASAGIQLDGSYQAGNGRFVLSFDALVDQNGTRDVLNFGELHYAQSFDNWDILLGMHTENWGVSASRSVVNVMNPTDQTYQVIGDKLLGTPMINANINTDFGTFSAYGLVGFIEPNYNEGRSSRFRSPWANNGDQARFESGTNEDLAFALRYSNNFSLGGGSLDVSASYFKGTSRDQVSLPGCAFPFGPISDVVCTTINDTIATVYEGLPPGAGIDKDAFWNFVDANLTNAGAAALSSIPVVGFFPYFPEIEEVGVTAVYAYEDLQLRFEGAWTESNRETSFAYIVGGDYTFNGIGGGAGDLTVALEYLHDDSQSPFTVFDDDIFLGLNYRFNNDANTAVNFGMFHDMRSSAKLMNLSVSGRINDRMSAEFTANKVVTSGFNDPLAFIKNDDFFELVVSAYF